MTSAPPPVPYPFLAIACLCALTVLLVTMTVGDIRHRRIPNRLCGAMALLALPWWLGASAHPFAQIGQQGLILLAAAPLLLGLFALRVYGGGDIKLFAALLLWVPVDRLIVLIVVTAMAGGLLAILLLMAAKLRHRPTPTVPYGVAIATGCALALAGPWRTVLSQTGI